MWLKSHEPPVALKRPVELLTLTHTHTGPSSHTNCYKRAPAPPSPQMTLMFSLPDVLCCNAVLCLAGKMLNELVFPRWRG